MTTAQNSPEQGLQQLPVKLAVPAAVQEYVDAANLQQAADRPALCSIQGRELQSNSHAVSAAAVLLLLLRSCCC